MTMIQWRRLREAPAATRHPGRGPCFCAVPRNALMLAALFVALAACSNDSPVWMARDDEAAESRQFDTDVVEGDLHRMMVEDYGLGPAKIQDVICPEGEPIARGHGFTCTLKYDGRDLPLTIRVLDEKTAAFEVSAPDLGE